MASYTDLIYQPGNDKRQGNALVFGGNGVVGTNVSGVFQRGDVVSYSGWYTAYSGKFRSQTVVISGSGL